MSLCTQPWLPHSDRQSHGCFSTFLVSIVRGGSSHVRVCFMRFSGASALASIGETVTIPWYNSGPLRVSR